MDETKEPWEAAERAAEAAGVALVALSGIGDAERVAAIVERLWGKGELSPALIRALQHAGTVLYGAEAGGSFVGFVLGFPGLQGGLHMHSHMLGVLPERQSRGVGYALKLAQRASCLDLGIREVRWTFDPLVPRNAWFNLVKLGTVATGLLPGFYGAMTDNLNRGDRSDRFEVVWRLDSERVARAVRGEAEAPPIGPVILDVEAAPGDARPRETGLQPVDGAVVAVPADHLGIRLGDPALGLAWRDAAGRAFQRCFDAGLVATWISRDGRYVFRPEREAWRAG